MRGSILNPFVLLLAVSGVLNDPALAGERPWTFMIYVAADNDADGPCFEFLDRVRASLDSKTAFEVVLFIDRSAGYSKNSTSLGADFAGARLFRLTKEKVISLEGGQQFPGITDGRDIEVDSADPKTLGKFIAFSKKRFPAQRYGLMIFSHADGQTMCPDDHGKTNMNIPELSRQIGAELSVDLMGLELCNMGGIEIAYEWRPGNGGFSTEVLVAIPNAGIPLDWDRAFARIRSDVEAGSDARPFLRPENMTPIDFGRLIIEEGYLGREAKLKELVAQGRIDLEAMRGADVLREAAGCYDLKQADRVKQSIDRFAVAAASQEGALEIMESIRGRGDAIQLLHYARTGKLHARPYVDLYALFDAVANEKRFSQNVRSAASEVKSATDDFIVASFGAEPGYGSYDAGRNGVFIVFPDGRTETLGRRAWTTLSWYTPKKAMGRISGQWRFLQDGAIEGNGRVENWYELLDFWFDDVSRKKAGTNGYAW